MKRPILLVFALLGGCSASPKPRCDDATSAFVWAQEFIRQDLKAPSTAKFGWLDGANASATPIKLANGRCAFAIRTPVDAQNGFGASIRVRYSVLVEPDQDDAKGWRLIELRRE